jgi:hypothetical protein
MLIVTLKWPPVLVCGFALSLLAGCVPLDDEDEWSQANTCNQRVENAQVQGSWSLSGTGEWSGCDNGVDDGESFELFTGALTVEQHEPTTGETDTLSLSGQSADVEFSGTVRGECVNFETTEQSGGESTSFVFVGLYTSSGTIEGDFTGTGPGSCESSGDFEVRVD